MKFIATEAGFVEGLGGASNTGGDADYHYIVFGYQEDEGHQIHLTPKIPPKN